MTEFRKCDYPNCNQHAKYQYRWYRFDGDKAGEIEMLKYSCQCAKHLAELSSAGKNDPEELVQLKNNRSRPEKLEDIIKNRAQTFRK